MWTLTVRCEYTLWSLCKSKDLGFEVYRSWCILPVRSSQAWSAEAAHTL